MENLCFCFGLCVCNLIMFWKSVGVVFDQRGVHPSLSLRMSVRNQNTQTLSSKVFHGRDQSICKDAHEGSNSRYPTCSECL
jgi:hypothetical protein